MTDFDVDTELIGRALKNIGACWLPSRVAEERARFAIPMEDLLDWLYAWTGGGSLDIIQVFDKWARSRQRGRDIVAAKTHACPFCGGPGAALCDHIIGRSRDAHLNTFTCDLVICATCVKDKRCPLHVGKPATQQVLTSGMATAVHRQLVMAAERRRTGEGVVRLAPPEQALQRGLFE